MDETTLNPVNLDTLKKEGEKYRKLRDRLDQWNPEQRKVLEFHDINNVLGAISIVLSTVIEQQKEGNTLPPSLISEYYRTNSALKSLDPDEALLAMRSLLGLYPKIMANDRAVDGVYKPELLDKAALSVRVLPLLLASTQFLHSPSPSSYFALETEAVSLGELAGLFKITCPKEFAGYQLRGARAIVAFNYLKNAKEATKNFSSVAQVSLTVNNGELIIDNPSKNRVPELNFTPNEKDGRLHCGLTICELYLHLLAEKKDITERRVIKDSDRPDSYLITTKLKLEDLDLGPKEPECAKIEQ